MSTPVIPTEDTEQQTFVAYLELRGLTFTAIPNSTYTTSWSVKNRNKAMGVRAGFPDMAVVLPGVGLLCIELKRTKGGVISPAQEAWITALNTCPGVAAHVCKGASECITVLESYYPQ